MRVVFLIRSLDIGGAERQLVTLVRNMDPVKFQVTVITYYPDGVLSEELQALPHVRLVSANKRGRWDVLSFVRELRKIVSQADPDVIHGYMQGANELALLLALGTRARVVWGVRSSELRIDEYDWGLRLLVRTGALLAGRADAIISNSNAGHHHHLSMGYPPDRFVVIPNGIDTTVFRRDETGRTRVRGGWGVSDREALIGIAARIDPQKDHETFLHAAAILCAECPHSRFAIVGEGPPGRVYSLQKLASELGIYDRVIWAGGSTDMVAVYSAFDIATSCSAFGEGVSNSLAEAMACETSCVATDIGDAHALLGDTGEIVPAREAHALAQAWQRALAQPPAVQIERRRNARKRITERFSVAQLARRTEGVLTQVMAGRELTNSLL